MYLITKAFVLLFSTLTFGCKFQISGDPKPMPYESIATSKWNNAFISEYKPQSSYMRMGGKDYKIKEAWVQHTHVMKDFYDSISGNEALVVQFYYDTTYHTDLKKYVKQMGTACQEFGSTYIEKIILMITK